VIRALQLISDSINKNVMSVDIGGATTDIFSNIQGSYFRTVSANYGMSYSISNVLMDAQFEKINRWLPAEVDETYIRNYIANKMLYPTYNPVNSYQKAIEQAIAREAIVMSKKQHMQMNFNTSNIGFLDKMKKTRNDLEKITEAFYFEKALEKQVFHMYEIDLMIGAGGILAHTDNDEQALSIIDTGFKPEGITEIWKDRDFISPHLGKLSAINEKLAVKLLSEECYDRIGIVIRPVGKKWKSGAKVMTLKVELDEISVKVGDIVYLPNKEASQREILIKLEKGFYLNSSSKELKFSSDLPLFIDASQEENFKQLNKALKMYEFKDKPVLENDFSEFLNNKIIKRGTQLLKAELPYEGLIKVEPGNEVQADTIVGENLYDPPRVYVISLFDKTYLHLSPDNIEESILIKKGDEIKYGQRIVEIGRKTFLDELQFQHFFFDSPVRGKVEQVNFDSGTIIMREIQDYSTKPQKINIAKKLNIKPKAITRYLKKNLNDFVYAGDLLASKIIDVRGTDHPMIVSAPSTGSIREIDLETGNILIKYDKDPHRKFAGVNGIITEIEPGRSATISYNGITLQGIIGFGSESWGRLNFLEDLNDADNCTSEEVVVYSGKIDLNFLNKMKKQEVKGVVAAAIDNADLISFTGKEIGVALTGNESIPFPVIFTEGFGEFLMDKEYADIFSKHVNEMIYLNGHTQIRAGVTRPKMIICLEQNQTLQG